MSSQVDTLFVLKKAKSLDKVIDKTYSSFIAHKGHIITDLIYFNDFGDEEKEAVLDNILNEQESLALLKNYQGGGGINFALFDISMFVNWYVIKPYTCHAIAISFSRRSYLNMPKNLWENFAKEFHSLIKAERTIMDVELLNNYKIELLVDFCKGKLQNDEIRLKMDYHY